MNLHCNELYDSLYITRSSAANNCCIQNSQHLIDLENIKNLDDYFKTDKNFQNIRENFKNNIKDTKCSHCWNLENNNQLSKRQRILQYRGIIDVPKIKRLDIRPSNKCNLQCRMCNPSSSDQIAKLALNLKKQGIDNDLLNHIPENNHVTDVNKLFNLITDLEDLEFIRFAGGEPFVMPEVENLIFKLIEIGKTNIEIEFITNCTSAKTNVINALSKFKKVSIACSIDGIGEQLEYQRYPSKWSNIEKNFNIFYNSNFSVVLTPCISILNLTKFHDFFEWSSQFNNIKIFYNEVDYPDFLNFRFVPMSERQELINYLTQTTLKNVEQSWINFKNTNVYEFQEMSSSQKSKLTHYVNDIWNRTSSKKFLDVYPWAHCLLD